ncbi:pknH-like extracellular domain protein [Mycobacterium kansasii]|uniref:PknH-like extracellular domain protein n=1 Tax=Mycobacterium kansasii TaxID=1768 RepID=A0A1V3XHE8_MYCKA|nr:pknH-like extracellular domain protein [Mycobacterium kansasii]
MGASNIQPGKPITSMDTSPVTLSLPDCQAALYTSQDPVYAGTGYTGISGLVSSEPGTPTTIGSTRPWWPFRRPTKLARSCSLRRANGKTVRARP